jgi:hypothetical protein
MMKFMESYADDNTVVDASFDVFLSYSESGGGFSAANTVYTDLVTRGLNVFFAPVTLPDVPRSDYGPVIHEVLEKVPVLLVVASESSQFDTEFAKHERNSYHNNRVLGGDKSGFILSYILGMNHDELPYMLRSYQSVQASDHGLETLFQFIAARLGMNDSRKLVAVAKRTIDRVEETNRAMGEVVLAEGRVIEQMMNMMSGTLGGILGMNAQSIDDLRNAIDNLEKSLKDGRK